MGDKITGWSMSAELYLKRAIKEVDLKRGNPFKMYKQHHLDVPVLPGYHPELDHTDFLLNEDRQIYQSYINIHRWAVKLG